MSETTEAHGALLDLVLSRRYSGHSLQTAIRRLIAAAHEEGRESTREPITKEAMTTTSENQPEGEDARRLDRFGADRLAGAVCAMIDRGVLDARSEPGDALLDYASARYGDTSPISRVRARYDEIRRGLASTPTRSERDGEE